MKALGPCTFRQWKFEFDINYKSTIWQRSAFRCLRLLKSSQHFFGASPRPKPRYFIPQSHSTLTHVPSPSHIYCLSSLKCLILTTLKIKHPTRKCFNLLKILKHNSKNFAGASPQTLSLILESSATQSFGLQLSTAQV